MLPWQKSYNKSTQKKNKLLSVNVNLFQATKIFLSVFCLS